MSSPYVVTGGPWPERVGLRARLVPPLRNEYPWIGVGRDEVVVWIDSDLLTADDRRDWTCVMSKSDLTYVGVDE